MSQWFSSFDIMQVTHTTASNACVWAWLVQDVGHRCKTVSRFEIALLTNW